MKKMLRSITIILVASFITACQHQGSKNSSQSSAIANDSLTIIEKVADSINCWTEIDFSKTGIIEKLAYADTANFMHEKIYPCAKCYLRPEAATALLIANQLAIKDDLKLVIFDCYRPKIYQQKMYDIVKNPNYVALPGKGSMHNKGLAVDLGLTNSKGILLDFGSHFDEFSEKAHFSYAEISDEAKKNRQKLREIMVLAGFEPYKNEWWHFSFTKATYLSDDFIWDCSN